MIDDIVLSVGAGGDSVRAPVSALGKKTQAVLINTGTVDAETFWSGAITANAGMNLNTSALALDATLTGGAQKAIARGGAKGTTVAGDITSNPVDANTQALHVDGSKVTQPVSGTVTSNQGTANATPWNENVAQFGGSAVATGTGASGVGIPRVTVSNDSSILGTKTNNAAIPGATNFGALTGIANEALPSYTEGNLVFPALDLRGALRSVGVPMAVLGAYEIHLASGTYNSLGANTPLWSCRWGDATRLCIPLFLGVTVHTTVAATTAGITERQLIIARGFTASDTGGTAATLTGNNQKRRTSMGTSLMTDLRIGNPITAGTRTLDAQPISSAVAWSPLNFTGVNIGGSAAAATGAVWGAAGIIQEFALYDIFKAAMYGQPQVFAQNEGFVMRIGAAQPAGATQQTFVRFAWAEANKVL